MKQIILWIGLFVGCSVVFAQELAKQPQTLITGKKLMRVTAKVKGETMTNVQGEMHYQALQINSDDTFTGKFVFTLAEQSRQKIAEEMNQPLSAIPSSAIIGNTVADFENHQTCPKVHLEIRKMQLALTTQIQLELEKMKLHLPETPQDVSKLVCRYAIELFNGRTHPWRRYGGRINALLKGESTDN
jgi:hypothetical protein